MLFGKEVITGDRQYLIIEKRILVFKRRKEYEYIHIKELDVNENVTSMFSRRNSLDYYGITGGKIKFDYGMKTIVFGSNIDLAEAKYLLENVIQRKY